ncbi:hypothetical protein ND861_08630 [Leptospira sp. 2 VSF19]|uniref:Uncharacterized protein n=1 Tax=Leptospira soteropolitanensis TaxID=2950025 RepID=A0AAW5VNB5_9LEPT|nr:hypothetical protein [Leptospira soteropolitanensis]MCW7492734.1 hypothetical protein [Leptospira soteropolitanensis]MCW7500417.1 hypothetical protein [Leptospira soteropolitanensis]MCW7522548.1 hypothetical protein [Leptospira soteropolitanensis]MCW7526404.1 hypothetical protein [Leptospira soteropolitanensis]MCW7530387.1 hypothetical protein [Leptospira soteropolitanensis]
MNWKELLELEDKQLEDPKLADEFNLVGHPEYPSISTLPPEETLEILKEFLIAEGQVVNLKNLLSYAPILEITLIKKNLPTIYG